MGIIKTGLGLLTGALNAPAERQKKVIAMAENKIWGSANGILLGLCVAVLANDIFIAYNPGTSPQLELWARNALLQLTFLSMGGQGTGLALTAKLRNTIAKDLQDKATAKKEQEEVETQNSLLQSAKEGDALMLRRDYINRRVGGRTQGRLTFKGKLLCRTLELPYLNNKRSMSCIPEGRYPIELIGEDHKDGRKYDIYLNNVKGRDGIAIHGSDPTDPALKQTRGCTLVSKKPYISKWHTASARRRLFSIAGESRKALQEIETTMKENPEIKYLIITT